MNNADKNEKDAAIPKTEKKEQKRQANSCYECEVNRRKVKEIQQTVSGRDMIIEMLQKQLKKFEDLYKKSMDDTEEIRFKYCLAVQDLSNLKEIYKKFEEENFKLNKNLLDKFNSMNKLGECNNAQVNELKKKIAEIEQENILNKKEYTNELMDYKNQIKELKEQQKEPKHSMELMDLQKKIENLTEQIVQDDYVFKNCILKYECDVKELEEKLKQVNLDPKQLDAEEKYKTEIEELKIQIDKYKKDITQCKCKNNDFSSKIKEYEKEKLQLQAEIKNLKEKCQGIGDSSKNYEKEKLQLQTEVKGLKDKCEKIGDCSKEFEKEKLGYVNEIKDLKSQIVGNEREMSQCQENLKELNAKMNEHYAEKLKYQNEIDKNEKDIFEWQSKVKELTNLLNECEKEKLQFQGKVKELECLCKKIGDESTKQFEKEKLNYENEIKGLKEQININEKEKLEFQEKIKELECLCKKIGDESTKQFEKEKLNYENEIEGLRDQINDISKWQNKAEESINLLNKCEKEKLQFQEKNAELEYLCKKIEDESTKQFEKQKLDYQNGVKEQINKKEKEISEYQNKIEKFTNLLNQYNTEKEQFQKKIKELEKTGEESAKQFKKEKQKDQNEIKSLKDQINKNAKNILGNQSKVVKLTNQLNENEKEKLQSKKKIKELECLCEKNKRESTKQFEEEKLTHQNEIKGLKDQINKNEKYFSESQSKIEELTNLLNENKTEKQQFQEKIKELECLCKKIGDDSTKQFEEEKLTYQNEIEDLKDQINKNEKYVSESESKIEELTNLLNENKTEKQQFLGRIEDLEYLCETIGEESTKQFEEEKLFYKIEIKDLQDQINEIEKELTNKINECEEEKEKFKQQIQNFGNKSKETESVCKCSKPNGANVIMLEELQEQLNNDDQKYQLLLEENGKLLENVNQLKQQIQELESNKNTNSVGTPTDLEEYKTANCELRCKLQDLSDKEEILKEINLKLTNENKNLNDRITLLTEQSNVISTENTTLENETGGDAEEQCQAECFKKQYENELVKKQNIIKSLEGSIEGCNETLEECEEELNNLRAENELLKLDAKDLKKQLERYSDLQYEYEALQNKFMATGSSKLEKSFDYTDLEESIDQCNKTLEECEEELNNLRDEKEALKEDAKEMRKQLEQYRDLQSEYEALKKQNQILLNGSNKLKTDFEGEELTDLKTENENLRRNTEELKKQLDQDKRLQSVDYIKEDQKVTLEANTSNLPDAKNVEEQFQIYKKEIDKVHDTIATCVCLTKTPTKNSEDTTLINILNGDVNKLNQNIEDLLLENEDLRTTINNLIIKLEATIGDLNDCRSKKSIEIKKLEPIMSLTNLSAKKTSSCDCMSIISSVYQFDHKASTPESLGSSAEFLNCKDICKYSLMNSEDQKYKTEVIFGGSNKTNDQLLKEAVMPLEIGETKTSLKRMESQKLLDLLKQVRQEISEEKKKLSANSLFADREECLEAIEKQIRLAKSIEKKASELRKEIFSNKSQNSDKSEVIIKKTSTNQMLSTTPKAKNRKMVFNYGEWYCWPDIKIINYSDMDLYNNDQKPRIIKKYALVEVPPEKKPKGKEENLKNVSDTSEEKPEVMVKEETTKLETPIDKGCYCLDKENENEDPMKSEETNTEEDTDKQVLENIKSQLVSEEFIKEVTTFTSEMVPLEENVSEAENSPILDLPAKNYLSSFSSQKHFDILKQVEQELTEEKQGVSKNIFDLDGDEYLKQIDLAESIEKEAIELQKEMYQMCNSYEGKYIPIKTPVVVKETFEPLQGPDVTSKEEDSNRCCICSCPVKTSKLNYLNDDVALEDDGKKQAEEEEKSN